MKSLFIFLAVFHLFTEISYGQEVSQQQIIFINNLVDPNTHEVETFTNLVAYPFINATNSSLLTESRLAINYTLIFSIEPDRIVHLQSADMDKYSMEYFQTMVKNYTANSCKGASLKVLRRVLDISSKPAIILIAVNDRPKGKELLREILEKMVEKLNLVFVFKIDEDGSISELPQENRFVTNKYSRVIDTLVISVPPCPPIGNRTENVTQHTPEKFKMNDKRIIPEFDPILEVTRDLFYIIAYEGIKHFMNAQKYPYKNKLYPFPKMSYNFSRFYEKRTIYFKTAVIKPPAIYISQSEYFMAINFKLRYTFPRNLLMTDWPVFEFSPQLDPVIVEENSANYSLLDSLTPMTVQIKDGLSKSSLKGLQKTFQLIPEFFWIPHYNIKNPGDEERSILPELIQKISLLIPEVTVYGFNNIIEMFESWEITTEPLYEWVSLFGTFPLIENES